MKKWKAGRHFHDRGAKTMKKWKAGRHLIHFGGNFAELFFQA